MAMYISRVPNAERCGDSSAEEVMVWLCYAGFVSSFPAA